MENPFKHITRNEKVPEYLRKRVIDDIALIKLSIALFDLAVVKYSETLTNPFKGSFSNDEKNTDSDKNNRNKP